MISIELPPDIEAIRPSLRRFVEGELEPWADKLDDDVFPQAVIDAMARQGLLGMRLSETWGGAGLSLAHYCLAQEELSRSNPIFTIMTASTGGLAPMAIEKLGTTAQKQTYLPRLTRGAARTAFALTEPGAGSDSAALTTRATHDDQGWILNGRKQFISGGEQAEVLLVMAVTDATRGARGITAFLVDHDTPGFSVTRVEHTLGSRAWTLAELNFDNCRLPHDAVIGTVGGGFAVAQDALAEGRLSVACTCLGAATRLLEMSISHARERSTFGKPLAQHQAIQWMLADGATELCAARSFTYHTLAALEAGKPIDSAASMCKLYCSEVAGRIADRAAQIHGASGVVRGYPVERFYRDLRLFRIGEGTSEIQRMVIARDLLR